MNSNYNIELIKTKTHNLTIKFNNLYLHSKYDPLKEAESIIDHSYKKNHVHILFGYGLGYLSKSLQRRMSTSDKLLVIDPAIEELNNIIEIKDEKVLYNYNEEEIEREITKHLQGTQVNATVICSPNYDKLFPTEYKSLLILIRNIQKINQMQRNTISYFASSWQENYIRNIIHIFEDNSLMDLKDKFKCPIVVASGGPSLIKQIPHLIKIRHSIILIAAGSTVNTLKRYKIDPDFVISIDGGEANYEHFRDNIFCKTKLIYGIRNHYKIRNQFCNDSYAFIPSIEPSVANHLKNLTQKDLPMLIGGTSVAVFALTIAMYITSGKIALIGQDLAYTENKTHAEYNKNYKIIDEKYKKERGMFLIEGYNGERVLSDTAFLAMKKDFEKVVEITQEADRIINCTEGGVLIKGMNQMKFIEFSDGLLSEKVQIFEEGKENINYNELNIKVKYELKLLSNLRNRLIKALFVLHSNTSEKSFDFEVQCKLRKIDNKLKKDFEKVSMNSIVDPITIDTLNNFLPQNEESNLEHFIRVYRQSDQLYSRLLQATIDSITYTSYLLNDINNKRGVNLIE